MMRWEEILLKYIEFSQNLSFLRSLSLYLILPSFVSTFSGEDQSSPLRGENGGKIYSTWNPGIYNISIGDFH